jgi:hypothetical protein
MIEPYYVYIYMLWAIGNTRGGGVGGVKVGIGSKERNG